MENHCALCREHCLRQAGLYELLVRVKDLTGGLVMCFDMEMNIVGGSKGLDENTLNLVAEDWIQVNI